MKIDINDITARKILSKCAIFRDMIVSNSNEQNIRWSKENSNKICLKGDFTIDELRSLILIIGARL